MDAMRAKKYRRFDQAGSAGAFVGSTATGGELGDHPSERAFVQARTFQNFPMSKPSEHKTVQARILEYAEAEGRDIGNWRLDIGHWGREEAKGDWGFEIGYGGSQRSFQFWIQRFEPQRTQRSQRRLGF
jgi:hypothetical protein